MFGVAIFALAAVGLIAARSRAAVLLGAWFTLIMAGWVGLTAMPGRFAVPVVVPLALLAGLGTAAVRRRWAVAALAVVAAAGGVRGSMTLGRLLHDENARSLATTKLDLPMLAVHGPKSFVLWETLNNHELIPGKVYLWLVGEATPFYIHRHLHYTVVFNRDPWLVYAEDATPEQAVGWLRTEKVTHVVFCWFEIDRLRRTYGFPGFVTPAWVAALEGAGLRRVEFPRDADEPYRDVYEVLPR